MLVENLKSAVEILEEFDWLPAYAVTVWSDKVMIQAHRQKGIDLRLKENGFREKEKWKRQNMLFYSYVRGVIQITLTESAVE